MFSSLYRAQSAAVLTKFVTQSFPRHAAAGFHTTKRLSEQANKGSGGVVQSIRGFGLGETKKVNGKLVYTRPIEGHVFYELDEKGLGSLRDKSVFPVGCILGSLYALSTLNWSTPGMLLWLGTIIASGLNLFAISKQLTRVAVIPENHVEQRMFPRSKNIPAARTYVFEQYGLPFSSFKQVKYAAGPFTRYPDGTFTPRFVSTRDLNRASEKVLWERVLLQRENFRAVLYLDQVQDLNALNQLLAYASAPANTDKALEKWFSTWYPDVNPAVYKANPGYNPALDPAYLARTSGKTQ